jgi:hypothetical protein
MNLHKGIAAGIVATAIAVTGCGHTTQAASNPANVVSPMPAPADMSGQPCSISQNQGSQASMYGTGGQDASQGYMESMYRPVMIVDQPVVVPASMEPAEPVGQAGPVYGSYYGRERGHKRHGRSKGKSAAIVVGSAAAGAGIGAIAGGGKGAAIGAASGGAAGFVYDRLTHH